MAEIPLTLTGWVYDEETNRVEAQFRDLPLADHPDPVNFRSTRFFRIEILPQSVEAEEREPEMPPESESAEVPTPPVPPVEE